MKRKQMGILFYDDVFSYAPVPTFFYDFHVILFTVYFETASWLLLSSPVCVGSINGPWLL